jgi:hypothetical protein
MYGKNNKCVLELVNELIFRDTFFFSKGAYSLGRSKYCLRIKS